MKYLYNLLFIFLCIYTNLNHSYQLYPNISNSNFPDFELKTNGTVYGDCYRALNQGYNSACYNNLYKDYALKYTTIKDSHTDILIPFLYHENIDIKIADVINLKEGYSFTIGVKVSKMIMYWEKWTNYYVLHLLKSSGTLTAENFKFQFEFILMYDGNHKLGVNFDDEGTVFILDCNFDLDCFIQFEKELNLFLRNILEDPTNFTDFFKITAEDKTYHSLIDFLISHI